MSPLRSKNDAHKEAIQLLKRLELGSERRGGFIEVSPENTSKFEVPKFLRAFHQVRTILF